MTVFLSSYTNGVDKKGRVSVPAPFRAEVALHSKQAIVVYAAPREGFLYAWGYDDFIKFAERINKMPPMSRERQRLARTLLAGARPLGFDSEGRILLPQEFLSAAGIDDKILFAGQGEYFTIWDPEKYAAKQAEDFEHYEDDIDSLSAAWEDV